MDTVRYSRRKAPKYSCALPGRGARAEATSLLFNMLVEYVRYSPIGEYIRLVIMRRLAEGPARVEEIDELARRAVEELGERYNWRVWPQLLRREVAIRGDVAELTEYGKALYENTKDELVKYLEKTLGVRP